MGRIRIRIRIRIRSGINLSDSKILTATLIPDHPKRKINWNEEKLVGTWEIPGLTFGQVDLGDNVDIRRTVAGDLGLEVVVNKLLISRSESEP